MVIKILVFIYWYTIRKVNNAVFNFIYWFTLSGSRTKELRDDYNMIKNDQVKFGNEFFDLFNKYYKGYLPDPFWGAVDWSPTLMTAMMRGKDDCDGMAVLYRALIQSWSNANGLDYKTKYLIAWDKKKFNKFHVMAYGYGGVSYNGLGDYQYFIFGSFEEVLKHYGKRYLGDEDISNVGYILVK